METIFLLICLIAIAIGIGSFLRLYYLLFKLWRILLKFRKNWMKNFWKKDPHIKKYQRDNLYSKKNKWLIALCAIVRGCAFFLWLFLYKNEPGYSVIFLSLVFISTGVIYYVQPSYDIYKNFWENYLINNPDNPLKVNWIDNKEFYSLQKKMGRIAMIIGIAAITAVLSYWQIR